MDDIAREKAISLAESNSAEAINATKNASEAMLKAQAAQLVAAQVAADERTAKIMTQALKDVFGPLKDKTDADQMHVLVPRIPLLCLSVENLQKSVDDINDNLNWATKVVIGAVILAAMGVILTHK